MNWNKRIPYRKTYCPGAITTTKPGLLLAQNRILCTNRSNMYIQILKWWKQYFFSNGILDLCNMITCQCPRSGWSGILVRKLTLLIPCPHRRCGIFPGQNLVVPFNGGNMLPHPGQSGKWGHTFINKPIAPPGQGQTHTPFLLITLKW